jgi:hypothetical protein
MSGFLGGGGSGGGGGGSDGYAATGTFIYREGEPSPSGNVYSSWAAAYAARTAFKGSAIIEIDSRFGSPTIPAGVYDMSVTKLTGSYFNDPVYVAPRVDVYGQFTNLSHIEHISLYIHSDGAMIKTQPSEFVMLQMFDTNIVNHNGGLLNLVNSQCFINLWHISGFHVSAGGPNINVDSTSGVVMGIGLFGGFDDYTFGGAGSAYVYVDRTSYHQNTQPIADLILVIAEAWSEQITVSYAGAQLPAAGVTRHADVSGGAALNVTSGWTEKYPYRGLTIARQAGGPANVTYTVTFTAPNGKEVTEDVTVAAGGSAQTNNAGPIAKVTTSVDPVGTTSFTTGNSFFAGGSVRSVAHLFADGNEILYTFYPDTSAILPTGTVPNGTVAFSAIVHTLPVFTA